MFKGASKVQRLVLVILIGGSVTAVVYQYGAKYIKLREKKHLRTSSAKKVVSGTIVSIGEVQKSTQKTISYQFDFKNKIYTRVVRDVFSYKCDLPFKGRSFPILIDSSDPSKSCLLFHKRDYLYFGYSPPDSMSWVFDCVSPSGNYWLSEAPISPE